MSALSADLPDERLARVVLSAISEPADFRITRLVAALGAVELVQRLRGDAALEGLQSELATRFDGLEPERILAEADATGIRYVIPGDAEWPGSVDDLHGVEPLNGMAGGPLGLWVKGPLSLRTACEGSVSVVGSRSATTYGARVAADVSAGLASQSHTVVSGAAYGIDQAAHRGALAGRGLTVAVVAGGVDRPYPAGNAPLLKHIAETGLVVSELRPGCTPTRVRFLSRNRLIAALSRGTVVVEAAARSGALNTANWAGRLNRVLMGVPGPVTSAPSEGVHELIRSSAAILVTRADQVLEAVGGVGESVAEVRRGPVSDLDRLEPLALRVLEAVPVVKAAPTNSVARTAGVSLDGASRTLEQLRRTGWVEGGAGGWRRVQSVTERLRI